MNICNDNHEEIVYNGTYCPLCELRSSSEEVISELTSLNKSLLDDVDVLNDMYNTIRDVVKSHAPELLI